MRSDSCTHIPDVDLKTCVVRQLDQRSAGIYRQCSRTCKAHLDLVANRRSTPYMDCAGAAPFVKSFACMFQPSFPSRPRFTRSMMERQFCTLTIVSLRLPSTDELDVALKTWSLRLRLLPRTGKDTRRYRLVVQTTEFFAKPWCRINTDPKSCTLDIFLPKVLSPLPYFRTRIGNRQCFLL